MGEPSKDPGSALAALRRDYKLAELSETSVSADPVAQFSTWFDEALTAELLEPNAMTLATVADDGRPAARTVLLKGCDARGFVFYTNFESRKSRHLGANARAALLFAWLALERQVEICGAVERVSREETESYFRTRPVESQLGAWASRQSEVLTSRAELEARMNELRLHYAGREIPAPPHWGGFRVVPETIEFWQGRRSRLHDRIRYTRESAPAHGARAWRIERLSP